MEAKRVLFVLISVSVHIIKKASQSPQATFPKQVKKHNYLYKMTPELVICDDINTDHLTESYQEPCPS